MAAAQPPLYYLLQTIPYWLASGGTLLDQLELMRLLSALMAALTALFAFLFVREALPGVRWAWRSAASAWPLSPLLGFMSGVVNPDALLFAVSAAIFYASRERSGAGSPAARDRDRCAGRARLPHQAQLRRPGPG